MKIEIDDNEALALLTIRTFIRTRPTPPGDFLMWLRDRLVHQYEEPENVDFVLAVEEYARLFKELGHMEESGAGNRD